MVTAQQIKDVTFSKPPIGKRGYNEDEVDAFLDAVEASVAQMEADLSDLSQRDERTLISQPEPVYQAAPPPRQEPISAQAARILELAERTAGELTAEAEATADRLTRDAEAKASETLAAARYEAGKLVDNAKREAADIERRTQVLRDFEVNYRGRLDTYIASQLEALRADGQVEPTQQ